MKKTALFIVLLLCSASFAEDKKFPLGETEKLKLKVAVMEAQLAAANLRPFQEAYDAKVKAFFDLCSDIRKQNKWDDKAQCDPNTLEFSLPPEVKPKPAAK